MGLVSHLHLDSGCIKAEIFGFRISFKPSIWEKVCFISIFREIQLPTNTTVPHHRRTYNRQHNEHVHITCTLCVVHSYHASQSSENLWHKFHQWMMLTTTNVIEKIFLNILVSASKKWAGLTGTQERIKVFERLSILMSLD